MRRMMKMLTRTIQFTALILLLTGFLSQSNAQEKRAQTSFKFISTPLAAKAAGMSDAVYSIEGGSESIFANPATMSRQNTFANITGGQVQFIADINYHYVAASFAPANGLYGVFGFHVLSVDYGDLQETIRTDNDRGYIDIGTFSPVSFSLGMSYARAISNQFSIGGTVKYLGMDLGTGTTDIASGGALVREKFKANVLAYDFGVHYKTGWKSLELGFAFKNLSQEVKFDTENSEIPLTFRMGISMDLIDLTSIDKEYNSLLISLNANRPRDFDEQIILGADYTFMKRFSLRAGYLLPAEEQGISLGLGLNQPIKNGIGIKVDYSYTNFGIFSGVNRLTVQFSF
jgi:hypothetical protein